MREQSIFKMNGVFLFHCINLIQGCLFFWYECYLGGEDATGSIKV